MIKLIMSLFEPLVRAWRDAVEIDGMESVEIRCGTLDKFEEDDGI
jgi:hypothetical protein